MDEGPDAWFLLHKDIILQIIIIYGIIKRKDGRRLDEAAT